MKTDRQRPRGRRSLLRGLGLALLALVAPGSATDAIGAPLEAPVDRFPGGVVLGALTPGADGALWSLSPSAGGAARVAPDGAVTSFGTRVTADVTGAPTTPLADGSLAQLRGSVIVRVSPAGVVSTRRLPARTAVLGPSALAADGSVWMATSCPVGATAPRIARIAPDGRLSRWRLSQRPCRQAGGYGEWTGLAIGGDGAVWAVNGCQGLVARVTVDGRLRQWPIGRAAGYCYDDAWGEQPFAFRPDADGGLRFAGGRITPAGRLIRDASTFVPELVTPDGSGWQVDTSVRQQLPDGSTRTIGEFGDPRWSAMDNGVVGADGNLWLTVGWVHSGRGFYSAEQVQIARVTPAGEVATTPLFPPATEPVPPGGEALSWPPPLTTGTETPVWATRPVPLAAPGQLGLEAELVRVGWSGGAPPAPTPRVAIPRTIARSGAKTWLQLACDVRPGRYCGGTVKLVRRDGTPATHGGAAFAIPGGERRPALVRLRLTTAERKALRRGRALRLTAVATVAGGGEQRHAVTIPPRT